MSQHTYPANAADVHQRRAQPSAFPSSAYIGVGFFALVVGLIMLSFGMADGGDGGTFVAFLGAVAAIVGQIMVAIGVIAKGVKLGNRES